MKPCCGCDQPTDSEKRVFGEPICEACDAKWQMLVKAIADDQDVQSD